MCDWLVVHVWRSRLAQSPYMRLVEGSSPSMCISPCAFFICFFEAYEDYIDIFELFENVITKYTQVAVTVQTVNE